MPKPSRDPFKPGAIDWLRNHLYAIPITVVVAACTAAVGIGKYLERLKDEATETQTTPSPTAAPSTPPTSLKIPDDQMAVISAARASLVEIAKKSRKAAELLAFYDQYGIPAIRVDDERSQVATAPTQPVWFFVVGNPEKIATADHLEHIGAVFSCEPRAMALRTFDASAFIKGVLLAHELQHATDCLVNHEPPDQYPEPAWLAGEMHAHLAVYQILSEYTDGGWSRLVDDSRDRREKMAVSHGDHPEAMVYGHLPEDLPAVAALFGNADDVTMGTLLAQLTVDAGMVNVDVQAGRYGITEDAAMDHRIEFMAGFYKNSNIDTEIRR